MSNDVRKTASWNTDKGEFEVIGAPALIMSVETFVKLQKNAEKILGIEGASVLFYETGKNAGEMWINRFKKEWDMRERDFIEAVRKFYAELGWGKFQVEENNQDELVVRVENSFIARGYGRSGTPICHFLRGYNAGIAWALKGRDVDAEEVQCAARGDSCCEFALTYVD